LQTVTFYSYKGGVGRTLVVANVARYLARFGQKVFVIDFDLEAPGLHYKFGLGRRIQSGLLDYIHDFATRGEIAERISPRVVEVDTEGLVGSIHLLPAGAAPFADYWRKLARINWHELFYSDDAEGIPFFLELKEKIASEFRPDYILIDSRTGITEIGGVATTLLADQVVCLLIYNQENLDGAREVLRSVRRAPRLPGQAPVELVPVLTRVPEQDEQEETRIAREVLNFLNEEASDLTATLAVPEVVVLHSDPDLQLNEALRIGSEKKLEESTLLRDYLELFARLIPARIIGSYMEPLLRQAVEKENEDPEEARKEIDALIQYSYQPEICRELLRIYRADREREADMGWMHGQDLILPNGVEAKSGKYSPVPVIYQYLYQDLKRLQLRSRHWRKRVIRDVHWGVDLRDLSQSGWGLIFSETDHLNASISEAIRPLLDFRSAATGSRCREYLYRLSESAPEFLSRYGVGPGPISPDRMPYYLLVVGSPEQIPQEFIYQLCVRHAVGRIFFDTLDEYRDYAHSVVAAETERVPQNRRIILFAPQNPGDRATEATCESLARPLTRLLASSSPDWEIEPLLAEKATKSSLINLLEKNNTAVLFTASQTVTFRQEDPRQLSRQGAIVCQEWPGPGTGPLKPESYFSADDISASARLHGLISIHVGSYTGGNSGRDYFDPRETASPAFVSRLVQRLLGHPKGGALAVIGQFEKSGTFELDADSEVNSFESALRLLMDGYPVGAAMDFLNQRHVELSARVMELLEANWLLENYSGKEADLRRLLIAFRGARTYSLLGDPAVRLPFEKPRPRRVLRG
jgi:MinD-like ATPase involved in chromosome partitioning or flagellar assembly